MEVESGERARRNVRVSSFSSAAVEILAVSVGLAMVWPFWHDDAFISFRYAERFLSGLGLTWSGTQPVEGYSHPLWLVTLIAAGAAGAPVPLVGKCLGTASTIALVVCSARRWGSAGVVALVVTQLSVLCWAVSGLETVGVAFLGVAACLALAPTSDASPMRASVGAGALAGLAPWLRPEGWILAPTLAVAILVGRRWGPDSLARTARSRSLPGLLVPAAVGMASLVAARGWMYGELLPNTAIAKLSDEPMRDVLLRGAAHLRACWTMFVPLLVGGVILRVARGSSALRPSGPDALAGLSLACLGLLGVGVVIAEGGDHMQPQGRLLVPSVIALGAALQALGSTVLARDRRARAALLIALVLSLPLVGEGFRRTPGADIAWFFGRRTGRLLEAGVEPGALVLTATAGSTAYYARDLEFIDSLGLNDPAIARTPVGPLRTAWQHVAGHQRGNGAYVLARRPDVVILGRAEGVVGNRADAWFLTDIELLESTEFRADYTPYAIPNPLPRGDTVYRFDPYSWRDQVEVSSPPPDEVREARDAGGDAIVVWLRNDSPNVARLRGAGVDISAWALPIDHLLYGDMEAP